MKESMTLKFSIAVILFFSIAFSSNVLAVKFYSINALFGISSRATNSICKDDNGFIWVSSKTGILRLTDSHCHIYQLPYDTTGVISVDLISNNSKLIAYTNNGQIFSYNSVYDRFELIVNLTKLIGTDSFYMYSLLVDDSGKYWVALGSGLYLFDSGKLTLMNETFNQTLYKITWYDKQHIIVANAEGIWLFDTQSLKSKCIHELKDVSKFFVSTFFLDKNLNMLWIGTYSNGLFCYNFSSKSFSHILQSTIAKQPILAIEENSDSTILIGIDGQGLWEIKKSGTQLLNVYKESADNPQSLRGNGVYDIFYDEGKRVWICTISGGVSFYELASPIVNQVVHQINNPNSLADNDVNSILEDREGKIWFATNNGISCWDVKLDKWKSFYCNNFEQSNVFLALCEDNHGNIWAGSYSSGIYVLDGKTGAELAHYSSDNQEMALVSNYIFDIYRDSQNDLWIGGTNGKFLCFQSRNNKFRIYSHESISSFAEYSSNQLLLGCSNDLKLLNKQTGDIQNILMGYVVQDMLVLGDVVWIATSGAGLVEYDMKIGTSLKYTTDQGLPSNFLNSIIYADNCLWVGTETGLCRFNPMDKTAYTFSSVYPLSGISFNKCAVNKLKNGQIVWGTNSGAILFTPQAIDEISTKGKIFFQELAVTGRSIRELSTFKLSTPVDSLRSITLKYSQNTFTVELIALLMQSGSKFSWKLEGFDKDWSAPSENRIVSYTNIPSGKYVLKIKLYDNSLLKIIDERSIEIKVIPPFWRKGWFWMIVILCISGVIFLYFMYYINKLKQKHTVEKVRFFTNTAHDIRTSLTLIKAPVEELSKEKNLTEKGKYYLNLAAEQARQLSTVVTQLMDFQKVDIGKEQLIFTMIDIVKLVSKRVSMFDSFAKGKNITLVFSADCQSYITAIDELKMEKIVDNLISNAIKYSSNESEIQIVLEGGERKWVLQVSDTGIGISKKAQRQLFKEFFRGDNAINSKVVGSGIGLLLVKNYVSMHSGSISFKSHENVGSTFQIEIPYKSISGGASTTNLISDTSMVSNSVSDFSLLEDTEGEMKASNDMKVLIVEDNDDLLTFMRRALNSEFKIYTSSDGEEAWMFISKQIPDLVVSDIMMPNTDGFELCKLIKSTYETSHIPVVLLTALSDKTDQLKGLGLGADDYLTKPFDMNLLIERIKSIIRNRNVVREKALGLIKSGSNDRLLENELNDKFVKKMLEVAQANISNVDFDKEEFASAMNVSSSLLYKKVKSLTDQSPTDFIKTIRLNHALSLLQSNKYTVTEVSELCGFTSLAYFSKVFRKHFGKSPSEIM